MSPNNKTENSSVVTKYALTEMKINLVSLATAIVKILAICDILQPNIFVISFEDYCSFLQFV